MNRPLRHVSLVVVVMFLLLFGSTTYIQAIQAPALNADSRNVRSLYADYGRHRGPIVVDGESIARSVPVDTSFGYLRTYDPGRPYAPVTGYYSVVYGPSGLEQAMNDTLTGEADALFYQRISDVLSGEQGQGATVELTLDPAIQEAAWEGLGDRRGAAIALDAETGAVLALVSRPTFDPNELSAHSFASVREAWEELSEDPADPLQNRAIAGDLYPVGSTFKLIVAAAALESGEYTAESVIPGPGELQLPQSSSTIPNFATGTEPCGPGGESTLTEALRQSCNTSFAQLGMDLGEDQLRATAQDFGFGQDLAIPLRVTPSTIGQDMSAAQVAQTALGQFDTRVTPLQMAMVSSAVANGGELMYPNLIQSVSTDDLRQVEAFSPQELSRPLSPANAQAMQTMMEEVVESGTGTGAQVPGATVGGKTGTAEWGDGSGRPHSWFTGYAQDDERSIAVAVVVEEGGYGSTAAVPVAQDMLEAGLDR